MALLGLHFISPCACERGDELPLHLLVARSDAQAWVHRPLRCVNQNIPGFGTSHERKPDDSSDDFLVPSFVYALPGLRVLSNKLIHDVID